MFTQFHSHMTRALQKVGFFLGTDASYIAQGGIWLLCAQGVNILAGLAMATAFANLLPKETFGVYRFVLAGASMFAAMTFPGLNTSLTKSTAHGNVGLYMPVFWNRVRWGFFGVLGSVITSGYYWHQGNDTLSLSFLVIAVFVSFSDPLNVYEAFRNGEKKFQYLALAEVTTRVLAVVSMIGALLIPIADVVGLVLFYFTVNTCLRVPFFLHAKRDSCAQQNVPDSEKANTLNYGKHLSFIYLLGAVAAQIDKIVIFHYAGAAALAAYAFAIIIPEQVRSMFKHIATLAYPRFVTRDLNDILANLHKKNLFMAVTAVNVIVIYIFATPFIYSWLFPTYIESMYLTQILSLLILDVLTLLPLSALKAHGATTLLYAYNVGVTVVQISFVTLGAHFFGLYGAIYGLIASRLVAICYLHIIIVWKIQRQ